MKARNNHGNIDLSFGDAGYVGTDYEKSQGAICSLATGAIRNFYLDLSLNVSGFYIQGRLANGQVDPRFGEGGTKFLRIVRPEEDNVRFVHPLYAIRTAANDCLVIGVLLAGEAAQAFVSKVRADGDLDLDYGENGTATFTLVGASSGVLQVNATKADATLCAVATQWACAKPRLKSVPKNTVATGQVAQDGGLIFSIRSRFQTQGDFIVKLDASGNLDEAFQGGCIQIVVNGELAKIGSVILDEQHRVVACGWIADYGFVARLTDDGMADTSFGPQGNGFSMFASEHPGGQVSLYSLLAGNAGRLFVGGFTDTYPNFFGNILIGLKEDGHLDEGFAEGGLLGLPQGTGFYFLSPGYEGRILAACRYLGWEEPTIGEMTYLWCITAQGQIEEKFGNGSSEEGTAGSQLTSLNDIVDVHMQVDGNVLLYAGHGGFSEPASAKLCRVLPDILAQVKATSPLVARYSH
ncbi:hypothetical protein EXN22_22370 [Pseudomonas tructae]|uniref:Delta-60 repeat domain-containing protein n=1 Tax=Pseudomonas tructae TaxID=2518644 RepID=A0A411MND3_9PSED|nr:hypothetical protein [Pseudomonas tructae]QBF28301.1 hypothetical protein EXN22_22370 [Pseudomonas tructae]